MIRITLATFTAATFLITAGCNGNMAATSFDLNSVNESFGQKVLYNNKVDILWIIDNSLSMQQHQNRLSQQIPDMVAAIQNLKIDYHIAVITTSMGTGWDGGQFIGAPKILTSQTPNLAGVLAGRLVPGERGSNKNQGLYSLETVLSPRYLSTDGAGFLRDDAMLAIIELSDKEDNSGHPANYYASLLDKLKPAGADGRRSWIYNFIGVLDASGSCPTFNDYSQVGQILMALADLSGGNKESICQNTLAYSLRNIKSHIVQIMTDFYLKQRPIMASIRVATNGRAVAQSTTNGWSYVENGNQYIIRFNGDAIPAADADIRIDYKPAENN